MDIQSRSPTVTNLRRVRRVDFVDEVETKLRERTRLDALAPTLDAAAGVLEEALRRDEESVSAHYLMDVTVFRYAAYTKAEEHLKRALELNGAFSLARLMLANVYIEQKQWQDALDHLDTYILENPNAFNRSEALAARTAVVRRLRVEEQ